MRQFLKLLACLLFVTEAYAAPADLLRDANPYTYALVSREQGTQEWRYTCTMTAFARQEQRTLFLTAAHCIMARREYIVAPDRDLAWAAPAHIEKVATSADLAVVSADIGEVALLKIGHDPAVGDAIAVVGWPHGMAKFVYAGNVAATANAVIGPLMVLYMPGLEPGLSGAAVFCREQQAICGVAIGFYPTSPAFGVAEPISKLVGATWLQRQGD